MAVDMIVATTNMDPACLTVAGVKKDEGVVIMKDRYGAIQRRLNSKEGKWFVVQTNWPTHVGDIWWDQRRFPTERKLE